MRIHLLTTNQLVNRSRISHREERKVRSRIITLLAACLLAIAFGSFLTGNSASAATGPALCAGTSELYCLNAWNGGPYVNVYPRGAANDNFGFFPTSGGNWVIQFFGSGQYYGDCVGDYNNNQYDARAGLWSNCTKGQGAWGVAFKLFTNCPNNEFAFKNNHWGGWLAPANFNNGDPFYLNNPSEYCFSEYG